MGISQGNSYLSERIAYTSQSTYAEISRKTSNIISDHKLKKESDERKKEKAIIEISERGYTSQLLELGKLSAYIEAFDNILISEQNIPQVGPFEDPTECQSFKKGYDHGKMLIKNGFSEINYKEYQNYYDNKYVVSGKKNQK